MLTANTVSYLFFPSPQLLRIANSFSDESSIDINNNGHHSSQAEIRGGIFLVLLFLLRIAPAPTFLLGQRPDAPVVAERFNFPSVTFGFPVFVT